MVLNATAHARGSRSPRGIVGFRGRRRNSFSSPLDICHEILHCDAGVSDHGPSGALQEAVIALACSGNRLSFRVGGRLGHTGQNGFGERVEVCEERLLGTHRSELVTPNLFDTRGKTFLRTGETVLPPRQFLLYRISDERTGRGKAALLSCRLNLFHHLL